MILAAKPVKTQRPKIFSHSALMAGVLGLGWGGTAQAANLLTQDFSTDPINYTISPTGVAGGGVAYWGLSNQAGITLNPNLTGASGTYLTAQDNDNGGVMNYTSAAPPQINFNVSTVGYSSLKLSLSMAGSPNVETTNFFRAFVDLDGNGSYETTIFNFFGNNNSPYVNSGPSALPNLTTAFQTFSNLSLGTVTAFDGILRLRFEMFNDTTSLNENSGLDNIIISGLATAANLTWTGAGNGLWDTAETNNWMPTGGSGSATYANPDIVTFDQTGVTNSQTSVAIATAVSPTSVTFSHTSGTYTFSGAAGIAGPAPVTMSGGGGVTFENPNTYTGPTTINSGTLTLQGTGTIANSSSITVAGGANLTVTGVTGGFSVANGQTLKGAGTVTGNVTVSSGAHLAPHTTPTGTATLNFANDLTLSSGSILDFNFAAPGASQAVATVWDSLAVTGALTTNAANILNVGTLSGFGVGWYQLASFSTLAGTTIGTISGPGRYNYAISNDASKLYLQITDKPALVWVGSTNSNWSTNAGDTNWDTLAPYVDGVPARFNDAGNTTVTITTPVNPAFLQFENTTAKDYTLTSSGANKIGGTGTFLLKTGDGLVTLNGSNSFTGTTTIGDGTTFAAGGTLAINNASSLGTGAIAINNATLRATAGITLANSIVLGHTGSTISVASGTLTQTGLITSTGSAKLNVAGGGELDLNNASNSFTGDIVLQNSTLVSRGDTYLGNSANKIVFQGGTIRLQNDNPTRVFDFTTGSGTIAGYYNDHNQTLASAGQLTGSGQVTFIGGSAFNVNAANSTFSGNVVVQAGKLSINNALSLGTTGTITVNTGATFTLSGGAASLDLSATSTGHVTTMQTGSTLDVQGAPGATGRAPAVLYNFKTGSNFIFPATYEMKFGANGKMNWGGANGQNNFQGDISLADGVGASTITMRTEFESGAVGYFTGTIKDGTSPNVLSLIVESNSGSANVRFAPATGNTYSGGTTVKGPNTLIGETSQAFGTGNVTVQSGGVLRLTNANNLASGKLVTVQSGGAVGLAGVFSPSDLTNTIDPTSTGKLYIDMLNYNGTLDFSQAPLMGLTLAGTSASSASFTGTVNWGAAYGNYAFSNLAGGSFTFAPASGSLTDNGATPRSVTASKGTIVLAASNSYTGGTFVTGGTLLAAAAGAIQAPVVLSGNSAFLRTSAAGAIGLGNGLDPSVTITTINGGDKSISTGNHSWTVESAPQTYNMTLKVNATGDQKAYVWVKNDAALTLTGGITTDTATGKFLSFEPDNWTAVSGGTAAMNSYTVATSGWNGFAGNGVLVWNPATVTGTGGMTVGAASIAVSNPAVIPAGNLSLSGGTLLLDGIAWSAFVGNRTSGYGTGANQWQLGGSAGFSARGSSPLVVPNGTGADWNRTILLGSAARGLDGRFYANQPVELADRKSVV